ncbi:magnesium transporter [Corallincola holothuriorum]|uniref:Magnesium transporter n=1 Tax=Corallincola holothuriorum TaxID=2282215 RepID=A0A368N6X8_9GAMM|nr:magnesium transporter [Corallincola holothuriorum]RCU45331.1 magnesium transporter [Corallincola holothuriorum]
MVENTAVPEFNQPHVNSVVLAQIIGAIDSGDPAALATLNVTEQFNDADIANLLESMPEKYRAPLCHVISPARAWPILHLLQYETARHIIGQLSRGQLHLLIAAAVEKDILTFAEILPQELVDEFVDQQEAAATEQLQKALTYQDEEVGRYTTYDVLRARPSATVARTMERMDKAKPRQFVGVYVVDANGVFHGGCTIGQVLSAPSEAKLIDICTPMELLSDRQDISAAARLLNPVEGFAWQPVQKEGKIVGAFAVSLLMQRLKDKSLEVLASDTPQTEEDLFTPVAVAARVRAVWLTANLLTAFLASAVIGLFEAALQQVVALAILMPVVASMGGIAGSQTLAVALRGIALNHLKRGNLKLLLDKEIKIAAFNGIGLGLLIGAVVWYWFDSFTLGGIIFVAIVFNSLAAASSGTVIPFVLKQMKVDPAVAGSVILTTVTDVVGFIIFLGLGSLLLTVS